MFWRGIGFRELDSQPIVAASILAASALIWFLWKKRDHGPRELAPMACFLLLTTVCLALSLRGLFSEQNHPIPFNAAIAYPVVFLLWPLLLGLGMRTASEVFARKQTLVACLLLGFGIANPVAIFAAKNRQTPLFQTRAGQVRVAQGDPGAKIYEYMAAHSKPNDWFLSLPFCNAVAFAARLNYATYTSVFWTNQVRPGDPHWQDDLRKFRAHRPEYVVVQVGEQLGTNRGSVTCPFPRLVWMPDLRDPSIHPLVGIIKEEYERAYQNGTAAVWRLKRPLAAAAP